MQGHLWTGASPAASSCAICAHIRCCRARCAFPSALARRTTRCSTVWLSMNPRRIVFLDRDGTLNQEVADEQIDSLAKVRLMPGVMAALQQLQLAGYAFIVVTNQDGLGTPRFPRENFELAHQFILELFRSQGIEFEAVYLCPHFKHEACGCRKPDLGMIADFLRTNVIAKGNSFMIGDRATDLEFAATLGETGLKITLDGPESETWPRIAARILASSRRAHVHRK